MLWSAADYGLPSNQEPALSEHFENLLMSMTQDQADSRPDLDEVLQVRYRCYFQVSYFRRRIRFE